MSKRLRIMLFMLIIGFFFLGQKGGKTVLGAESKNIERQNPETQFKISSINHETSKGEKESGIIENRPTKLSDNQDLDSSNFTIEYTYGYEFYAKYGRYMPITVHIENNFEDFRGWIEASIPMVEDNMIYRKEVNLPYGESGDISMVIPLADGFGEVEIKLIDYKEDVVLESINSVKSGNYEKILYVGMLTENEEGLSYLDSLITKTFVLDESSLPSDYRYLDPFDIILINDFNTKLLTHSQKEELKLWILNGGSLVLGSGENLEKTLLPLAKDFEIDISSRELLEANITNHINKDYLEELTLRILRLEEERKLLRDQIEERNNQLSMYGNPVIPMEEIKKEDWLSESVDNFKIPTIMKQVANVDFSEGEIGFLDDFNTVSLKKEEGSILKKKEYGKGNILLYNFDLSLEPSKTEEESTFEAIILNSIISNLSYHKQRQIEEEKSGDGKYFSLTNSMSYTDTKNIPKVKSYLGVLLLYIIIIGPLSYLILKKKDKLGLTWLVVPVLALIFTFAIYLIGSKTRVDDPFIGYVELRTFKENDIVEDELYFSITAPYNDKYYIDVSPHYPITEVISEGNPFSYGTRHQIKSNPKKYMAGIHYGLNKTRLEINNNPAFAPVFFQSVQEYKGSNPIKADIHFTGDKLTGTISNESNYNLTNGIYVGDGLLFSVGTLNSGQTVNLEDLEQVFIHDISEIYQSDLLDRVAYGMSVLDKGVISRKISFGAGEVNRKREILYYLIDQHISSYNKANCFIGFKEDVQADSFIQELSKQYKAYGTKVVLSKIEVDYGVDGKELVPSINSFAVNEGMDYLGGKAYYFNSAAMEEEDIVKEYYLPKGDRILSIEYFAMSNQDPVSDYHESFDGKIYALNRRTGSFDPIFTSESTGNKDTTLIPEDKLVNYLSQDYMLTLRYEAKFTSMESIMLLPNISYWKE